MAGCHSANAKRAPSRSGSHRRPLLVQVQRVARACAVQQHELLPKALHDPTRTPTRAISRGTCTCRLRRGPARPPPRRCSSSTWKVERLTKRPPGDSGVSKLKTHSSLCTLSWWLGTRADCMCERTSCSVASSTAAISPLARSPLGEQAGTSGPQRSSGEEKLLLLQAQRRCSEEGRVYRKEYNKEGGDTMPACDPHALLIMRPRARGARNTTQLVNPAGRSAWAGSPGG